MQAIAEAPSSPDLAAGPAAVVVVVPASVPVATPSRSWRFCRHHLQAEGRIRNSPSEHWYPPSWGFGGWIPQSSPYSEPHHLPSPRRVKKGFGVSVLCWTLCATNCPHPTAASPSCCPNTGPAFCHNPTTAFPGAEGVSGQPGLVTG